MKHKLLRHTLQLGAASLACAAFIGVQSPTPPAPGGAKTAQGTEAARGADDDGRLSENKGSAGGKGAGNEPGISPQNDKEKIVGNNTH